MDNTKRKSFDLRMLMPRLGGLDWSNGLTREQLRRHLPDFPPDVYLLLPSERQFHSPEELATFYSRAWTRSQQEGIPASGAAEDGGPDAWGPSPPSVGAREVGGRHGVGSGADSGYTGSDEVGTEGSGAPYGPYSGERSEE